MRPFYAVAGIVALGLGLAGWATLGWAQTPQGLPPLPELPMQERPAAPGPVRVLEPIDGRDIGLPGAKAEPVKPAAAKEPTPADIKPVAFIPNPDGPPKPPAAEPTGPAARQEPAVSLEWAGPTVLKVGAPAEYALTARNTSAIPLHKVIVQMKVPTGAKVASTEPKADGTEAVLVWDHGVLAPRQEKTVKIRLVPPTTGELLCQAWVTFTGSSALKVQVREPKLAVKVQAPEKVTAGDSTAVTVSVSNPGDHPADGVKLAVALGAGLEGARGAKSVIEVGTLAAGETREVKVPCVARVGGAQKCDITAEGDGGLSATGTATVTILQPRLGVEVTGPKLRYLDRKAAYAIKLSNAGDAPAGDVVVTEAVPAGFKFVSADAGGKYDPAAKTVRWSVGEVGPGQAKELKCELVAIGTGDHAHTVVAVGARGVRAEKAIGTKVEGLSALSMQVSDTDDPVEVGGQTSYEVRVTNTGSKDETDVKLVCTIPPQMKFKSAKGPGRFEVVGNEVVFEPVKSLAPKADIAFQVTVTAQAKGDARFKATLTAGGLSEPVIKQESTRVYAD